jgi:hypothetical protein
VLLVSLIRTGLHRCAVNPNRLPDLPGSNAGSASASVIKKKKKNYPLQPPPTAVNVRPAMKEVVKI